MRVLEHPHTQNTSQIKDYKVSANMMYVPLGGLSSQMEHVMANYLDIDKKLIVLNLLTKANLFRSLEVIMGVHEGRISG